MKYSHSEAMNSPGVQPSDDRIVPQWKTTMAAVSAPA